jgi:hypothetical protein
MTFNEWVQVVANTLGLTEWKITVVAGETSDDVIANVVVPFGRHEARITLGPKFYESDATEKRETILHELLHCHFADLDELEHETLPQLLGKPAYTAYDNATNLALEHGIDALACAIAEMDVIPLPPEEE